MDGLKILSEIKRIKRELCHREISHSEAIRLMKDLSDFYGLTFSRASRDNLEQSP